MAAGHLRQGRRGEDEAGSYLERRGYTILDRNWRTRLGELDIVCRKGKLIVFVEVKTRAQNSLAAPGDAVTRQKQQRLIRAASAYLSKHGLWDRSCRFDLITVVMAGPRPDVEHTVDVFQFSDAVGRGHTAWQPW